jgi:ATP/maltotriose-dependent transcriptional regulator MalT
MDLLERAELFQQLQNAFAEVTQGQGRLALVYGEAGIGKTSLVEQFVQAQEKQTRVLWGSCDALFTPRPLGPLYDVAQQIRGDLITLLEEEAPRTAIFSATFGELRKTTSTVLVIEDVHWADEATLDLLKFLSRRINKLNALLIITYRDDEIRAEHPLRLVLGDLPRRFVRRIRLPPLSEQAVGHLAERAGKHIDDLYTVTSGNPFFVTEVLASSEAGVPVTISDAVLSRVARLSPAARGLVELVSVVPAKAELWLVNDAIEPTTAALEECSSSGMLLLDEHTIGFRHELARRSVEDSLPAPRVQSLHAHVLKALLKRGAENHLARVVHHAAKSGDSSAVLEYAPLAARQAAALNAHREAASHYLTELQYADKLTPEERAELFECRSYECYLTDQMEEALQARREALQIWKRLSDQLRQGDSLRWMSRFAWALGRNKEAESHSIEAVRILENSPPGPQLAMAYSNLAQLHMLSDESPQAVLWGSRAIELAEKIGATETLVHALNNVGSAELDAGNEQGRVKLEESLQLALANNLQDHVARAYTNLGACWLRPRNYPLALRYFDEGIAYTTEHDLDSYRLYMTACRAQAHFEHGDWDSAADDAGFVLERYQPSAIAKVTALAVLGHLRVRRGDPDAERLLEEARKLALESGELQRIWPVASARAESAWLKSDTEQLMNEARSLLAMASSHVHPWLKGEFAFWMWRANGMRDTHEEIAAPYALHISGDWRAAAEAWRKIGCPYEEAMALADGDEAAQLSALEIFERLGARPAAEKLRHALRVTGVRRIPRGPRPSTKTNPYGLTNRQMEVLALMNEGRSNAEIAGRLFISAKTVDHHVSAILAKLDAHTRAEAVSLALQSNLLKSK